MLCCWTKHACGQSEQLYVTVWLHSFEWPDPVRPGLADRFAAAGEKEQPGRVRPGLSSQKERSLYDVQSKSTVTDLQS